MIHFVLLLCISSVLGKNILPLNKTGSPTFHSPRILNGQDAQPGQFPWQVYLVNFISDTQVFACNGAIISERWILTSASCVNQAFLIQYKVGSLERTGPDGVTGVTLNYVVHEEYDPDTLQNDIGLLSLLSPLSFDKSVSPITLDDEELDVGVTGTVSGWGSVSNDQELSDSLQFANVTTISNSDCQEIYGSDVIVSSMVCISSDSGGAPCFGDSGAPFVVDGDGSPVLAAVFSFVGGDTCGDYPAGYTRTAYYRDWIRDQTGI